MPNVTAVPAGSRAIKVPPYTAVGFRQSVEVPPDWPPFINVCLPVPDVPLLNVPPTTATADLVTWETETIQLDNYMDLETGMRYQMGRGRRSGIMAWRWLP